LVAERPAAQRRREKDRAYHASEEQEEVTAAGPSAGSGHGESGSGDVDSGSGDTQPASGHDDA
jgi:hypothetical protein